MDATVKKVKIIECYGSGEEYEGLYYNSVHAIVDPPKGHKNDSKGVWVMGKTRPVKIYSNEFKRL